MKVKKCQQCNKEFISTKDCKTRIQKFCSRVCYGKSTAKWKSCAFCKKQFYYWHNKKFCSNKCKFLAQTGKPFTDFHKAKLSSAKKGKYEFEKSYFWKGDKVGYHGLHKWVVRVLGNPNKCEHCKNIFLKPKSIQWANKSQQYKRLKSDWVRLCIKCHADYDKKFREQFKIKSIYKAKQNG